MHQATCAVYRIFSLSVIFGHVQKNDSTVNYVSFTSVCFKTTEYKNTEWQNQPYLNITTIGVGPHEVQTTDIIFHNAKSPGK